MTQMIRIPPAASRDFAAQKALARSLAPAAESLRAGGLVAFPTETVYGLGANALDADAVARIFAVKGRPASDPLIVHVLGMEDAAPLVTRIPGSARRLAEAFWPGPLTLILPAAPSIPSVVTAGLDSVALRAPSHEVARALIALARIPVAAPSANPFGRISPTTAAHVLSDLGGKLDFIVDGGPAELGVESTVVDCRGEVPRVLRPGGIGLEALRAVVGAVELPGGLLEQGGDGTARGDGSAATASGSVAVEAAADEGRPQRSPGMLLRHYAPKARALLLLGEDDVSLAEAMARAEARLRRMGRRVALLLATEDLAHVEGTAGGDGPNEILEREAGAAEGRADGLEGGEEASAAEVDGPPAIRLVLADRGDASLAARRLFAFLREADERGAELIIARDFGARGLGLAVRDRLYRASEGRLIRVEADAVDRALEEILAALVG